MHGTRGDVGLTDLFFKMFLLPQEQRLGYLVGMGPKDVLINFPLYGSPYPEHKIVDRGMIELTHAINPHVHKMRMEDLLMGQEPLIVKFLGVFGWRYGV